jgi:hypothetical protein
MGIFIPWLAKHLLRGVLSHTPGNFLAEYTWNASLKQEARIGALPVLTTELEFDDPPLADLEGAATLTKENRSL